MNHGKRMSGIALLMIPAARADLTRPVNLLEEHDPEQFVGERHF